MYRVFRLSAQLYIFNTDLSAFLPLDDMPSNMPQQIWSAVQDLAGINAGASCHGTHSSWLLETVAAGLLVPFADAGLPCQQLLESLHHTEQDAAYQYQTIVHSYIKLHMPSCMQRPAEILPAAWLRCLHC